MRVSTEQVEDQRRIEKIRGIRKKIQEQSEIRNGKSNLAIRDLAYYFFYFVMAKSPSSWVNYGSSLVTVRPLTYTHTHTIPPVIVLRPKIKINN